MSIKKAYGSALIRKPGAYSRMKTDNSAGAPLGANTTLFLIGESSIGAPGDVEGIQEFDMSNLDQMVAKYGSGPLVDCALAARSPSKTPGIGGASRLLIWKTNSSTQSTVTLSNATPAPVVIVKDKKWGASGNDLSITLATGSTANQKLVTINKLNDTAESLGENPARSVVTIDYTGDASAATLTISGVSESAKVLSTALTGQTDSSANLSIQLKNYTVKQLVDFINAQPGYVATLGTASLSVAKATDLDPVTAIDILTVKTLYRVQKEIVELINETSDRAEAVLAATPVVGVPANVTNAFFTGGAQGASANSDFSAGLAKSLAKTYAVALPCVSRDASEDIAAVDAFTDAGSTYTIAAVLTALDSHLRLRGEIKNRKEAQGMGGVRKSTKAAAFSTISGFGSELLQLTMQDTMVADQNANLVWKGPHVQAALMAGIRLGTSVGEPLTHKYLNTLGIGHFVNVETGLEAGDFNEALDCDDAIDNGVLFAESATGGFRVVVDNTTYGADQSFVWNRGSVIEAAQFTARTIRETAELVFVGGKVSNGIASSIKNVIRAKLMELNAPDVNIITSSADAPFGFREDTFVVTVQGNTAKVQVEIKPVQGLDFVFIDFTLGDISQQA